MSEETHLQPNPRRKGRQLLWLALCLLLLVGGLAIYRWLNPRLVPVTRLVLPEQHTFFYYDGYGFPKAYFHFTGSNSMIWMLDERGQVREKIDPTSFTSSRSSHVPAPLKHLSIGVGFQTVFTDKERKLVIDIRNDVLVYERGRLIASMHSAPDPWLCLEDGTVWRESSGKLHVLKWRSGKPALTSLALPMARDENVIHIIDYPLLNRCSVAALWGDGRYIAVADTRPILPKSLLPIARRAAAFIKQDEFPSERRRLTLYRDGKKVGTCSVNLKPSGAKFPALYSTPVPQYYEHLAFSRDGKYLAWCIDAGRGWQLFVFKVQ